MPRTAGVFALLAGTKGVTLQTIQSGKYNAFLDDLVNDLNAPRPILAGGTGASTADGAAKELGLVSAKDMAGVNTVGGTANAVTIATDRLYTALTSALFLRFIAKADIAAGGMTINLDSIGAKPVKKVVAVGQVDVNAGDIIEGGYYELGYDPASDNGADPDGAFILLNPGNASSAYQVGDFFATARTLNSDWLKRNGAVYNKTDYPELGALLPALSDTVSWTEAVTGQSNFLYAIAQGSGKYVAVGNTGTLLTSSDRSSWASVSPGTTANLQFVVKTPSLWLAAGTTTPSGGGATSRSSDALSWTASSLTSGNFMTEVRGLCWTVTNILISGYDGTGSIVHKVLYGTDGASWTAVTGLATSGPMAASTSRVVMVSKWDGSGIVQTSDNQGVTWTTRVASGFGNVNDVCWDAVNSLFIAVGDAGLIKTSPDGIAWTTRASGVSFNLLSVRAGPNGIMAVGGGQSTVAFSTNGTTWAAKASPATTGRALLADTAVPYHFLSGRSTVIADGVRTLPTQFQVPNDDPTYGWIKAVS